MKWSPKQVKRAREREGWSLVDIARVLEVSPQTVWRWEQGRARPRHRYVVQIQRLLERDLKEAAAEEKR